MAGCWGKFGVRPRPKRLLARGKRSDTSPVGALLGWTLLWATYWGSGPAQSPWRRGLRPRVPAQPELRGSLGRAPRAGGAAAGGTP